MDTEIVDMDYHMAAMAYLMVVMAATVESRWCVWLLKLTHDGFLILSAYPVLSVALQRNPVCCICCNCN